MKSFNVLLAWAHATVIEDLLEKQDVKLAIADKFGDEQFIINKLKTKGQGIELIQAGKSYVSTRQGCTCKRGEIAFQDD